MNPTLDHPNRRAPPLDLEAQVAIAQRIAAEQINDLTLSLLTRMMTMTQAVIDAANRIAASSQAAGALISQLVSANSDLSTRNADLVTKLTEAQANQADPNEVAEDQAAADRLNGAADSLDAAVASAQSAQGGAPVEPQPAESTPAEPVVEPTPEPEPVV